MFVKRASVGFLAALLLLTAAAADAGWQQTRASGATARAYAIRVAVPDQPGAETPTVSAPEDSVVFSGSFDYNKLVTSGSANASAVTHTLLLCQGSARHAASEWKHDLMRLGSSGSVWRIDLTSAEAVCIADRLAFPFGIMASRSGAILVTESWRHRLLSFASQGTSPEVVLADLPAYPARISAAADGRGAWL